MRSQSSKGRTGTAAGSAVTAKAKACDPSTSDCPLPATASGPAQELPDQPLPALSLAAMAPDAVRSDAGRLGALLLLDRALREAGTSTAGMIALCRQPGAMLTLSAASEGFVDLALALLVEGAILHGRVQALDLHHTRAWRTIPFAEEDEWDWRILTLALDERWHRGAGQDADGDEKDARERLAHAARSGHPLIVVARSDAVTPLIRLASHLCLDAGALDTAILTQAIVTVTGHPLDAVELRLAQLVAEGVRFEHLPLTDLSLAVRPGLSLDRIVTLLERLGRRATAAAAERVAEGEGASEEGEEDDDDLARTDLRFDARSARSHQSRSSRAKGGGDARSGDAAGRRGATTQSASDGGRSRSDSKDAGSIVIEPDGEDEADSATHRRPLTVETMAGLGAARDWALGLKADLALWRTGEIAWDAMSTRLLLHGPPGTGKTSFARALANTLDLPLHVASVQVWLEPGYLGSVLKRMSSAFAAAAAGAPAILFIDEADAIGRRQPDTKEYADYWNSIVNRMLELMDGAVRSQGIIVLGATNRPEALDAALTRSGRWERQIALPKPDRAALAAIIAHHLGDDLDRIAGEASLARLSDDEIVVDSSAIGNEDRGRNDHLDCSGDRSSGSDGVVRSSDRDPGSSANPVLDRLSRRAVGRTGADIERTVREARGRARRERRAMTLADLLSAFDDGRPRLSPSLRRRMAIHEAGHALVQHALGVGSLVSLSIEDMDGGSAISRFDLVVEHDVAWITAQIAALLAGRAAEVLVLGTATAGSGGDASSDLARATELALSMEVELGFGVERPLTHRNAALAKSLLLRPGPLADAVETRLRAASTLATQTLVAHRARLLRLADLLEAKGSLDAGEIAAILDGWKGKELIAGAANADAAISGPMPDENRSA